MSVVQRQSMLGQIWDYHHPASGETVKNVEGLCRSVMNRNPRALSLRADSADWDDALRHLLGEVTVVAQRYAPRDRGSVLGAYLKWKLAYALSDYLDLRDGRNGEKRVPDSRYRGTATADSTRGSSTGNYGFDNGDLAIRGPDQADPRSAGDHEGDRAFPRGWAEREGDRPPVREVGGLGVIPDREAAPGADPGREAVGGGDERGAAGEDRGARGQARMRAAA